ncbi:hypothetical protein EVAR_4527_1 [Eumeta japonica]|uniref:Uncharacterized protein n=1 Tax=Eumeta variegata TaxID=151549 RepID=A0A4C1SYM2_EUMVA|nr:hypothetical protein EVAR_4527_1 [Eumeta japonica]
MGSDTGIRFESGIRLRVYLNQDRKRVQNREECKLASTAGSGLDSSTKGIRSVFVLAEPRAEDIPATAQDTEAYLLKTQNAITNLQAKLQSSRTNNLTNIPSQLTSSLISEKTLVSRLPVSQLSRSNSLNYRLRRKDHSGENSPLRSPGHYVITGSTGLPASSRLVINTASRSLEAERRRDSNMNSPSSDRGLLSNSSDEKTLSSRPVYDVNAILSPHRKAHARHKSFDGKSPKEYFALEPNSKTVSLKTVLKNNALDAQNHSPRNIDQMKFHGDAKRTNHQRGLSDVTSKQKNLYQSFGNSIKRSSSFNTVNKNNNYLDSARIPHSRRSSDHSEIAYKDLDYLSDESDNGSYDKSQETRYKRPTNRGRIDSPDLKSIAPSNSPRCPNTPEMQRKFGPNLTRNALRAPNSRLIEQPKPSTHQSRRIAEPNRQAIFTRLTKSRSSTREFQPKNAEKGTKKPAQYRSSSALASKEIEFSNWKKRSSYDPMKAAQEGRKRQQQTTNSKRLESNKDDFSSPSHSSPVHRSQSFHSTNLADLEVYDYSSEGTEDEKMVSALPMDHPMITSTHSDTLEIRPRSSDYREALRRQALKNDVVLSRDYVTNFQYYAFSTGRCAFGLGPGRIDRWNFDSSEITPPAPCLGKHAKPSVADVAMATAMMIVSSPIIPALDHRGGDIPAVLRLYSEIYPDGQRPANLQVNHHPAKKRGDIDKRKTFIVDDVTPTKDNIEFLMKLRDKGDGDAAIDKRKTFILDSDTNSTTNGSSPRTSSIFSQEKSLTTATSDTEGESGTESAPVMRRPPNRRAGGASHGNKRFSGDFSMSSSTTSIGREQRARESKKDVQPRYLDISKYKSENTSKNFLRRDPSKTYVSVLSGHAHADRSVSKGSAQQYELEQKKQELEKWKRRASYDPRKAAAQGKTSKTPPKTAR